MVYGVSVCLTCCLPGITENYCAFRKLELGDFGLHRRISECSFLDGHDLIASGVELVAISVDILSANEQQRTQEDGMLREIPEALRDR
jgi:hypothetical protein